MEPCPAEILLIQSPAPAHERTQPGPEPERHPGARPGPEGSQMSPKLVPDVWHSIL